MGWGGKGWYGVVSGGLWWYVMVSGGCRTGLCAMLEDDGKGDIGPQPRLMRQWLRQQGTPPVEHADLS